VALTAKQQAFVREYLVDLNATQAAIRAGYSAASARLIGCENLTKPDIVSAIEEAKIARSHRTQVTADRVVEELARIAFSDLRRAACWGPEGVTLLPSDSLDDAAAASVESVSQTTTQAGGSIRIKLHPKTPALKTLAEHTGVLKERTPLETLIALLPPELAGPMREAFGRYLANREGEATGGPAG
jgi:phage terminase small subunit